MNESVTLIQLLAGSGVSIFSIIGGYVAIKSKITKMETDIDYLKREDEKLYDLIKDIRSENQAAYSSLDKKMDDLISIITDIKIDLNNKKDKQDE